MFGIVQSLSDMYEAELGLPHSHTPNAPPDSPSNELITRPGVVSVSTDDLVSSLTEHHLEPVDAIENLGKSHPLVRDAVKGLGKRVDWTRRARLTGECENSGKAEGKM